MSPDRIRRMAEDEHISGNSAPGEWYLKANDESIYGPLTLTLLRDWAAHARIHPGNQVSQDKQTWQSAEDLPELKMNWIAKMRGRPDYGPFSLLAAPLLAQRGKLTPGATLTNRRTNNTTGD